MRDEKEKEAKRIREETREKKKSEALVVFMINFVRRGRWKYSKQWTSVTLVMIKSTWYQSAPVQRLEHAVVHNQNAVKSEKHSRETENGGALQVAYTALEWKLNSCISYSSSLRFRNSEDAISY